MKVTGPSGPTSSSASRPAARSGGGFAVSAPSAAAGAAAATATSAASGVAGVSALMALQGVESATERRRRAIRRGHGLLDRLDALKLALMDGEAGEGQVEALARQVGESRPDQETPELDFLLDQIDLRAAVELAKAELRRSAA